MTFKEVCGFLREPKIPNQSTKCQKKESLTSSKEDHTIVNLVYIMYRDANLKLRNQCTLETSCLILPFKLFEYQHSISWGLNGNSQSNHNLHSSTKIYPEVTKQRCKLLLQKFNVMYPISQFQRVYWTLIFRPFVL